jgi:hypothetical protein
VYNPDVSWCAVIEDEQPNSSVEIQELMMLASRDGVAVLALQHIVGQGVLNGLWHQQHIY